MTIVDTMGDDVRAGGDDDERARPGLLHPPDRHPDVGRLRLVSLIAASAGGEACVCDLNDAFDLTQATVSHHLKVLHSAGVLDRDKRGVWVYYAVRPEALTSVATLFDTSALTPA